MYQDPSLLLHFRGLKVSRPFSFSSSVIGRTDFVTEPIRQLRTSLYDTSITESRRFHSGTDPLNPSPDTLR